jgi:aspartyl-tRNA synthetase
MYISAETLKQKIGTETTIGGFVNSIRDHGGLVFIDVRNDDTVLQCVVNPQTNTKAFELSQHLRSESVVKITGVIQLRSAETLNGSIPTGGIELLINGMEIIAMSQTLPFDIHAEKNLANEDIRLKYRYLDLRRNKLKNLMKAKHTLVLAIRNWFDSQDFIEVQTPILANSSPEGARDYLIPSRVHPGKFYALPQSPQQFKQLLMIGGFNKYIQISPCFRDEDPRADRHPGDFYQIDGEVAWAHQEDIFEICESLVSEVISTHTTKKIFPEFTRLTYNDAIESYGSDKPDLRYEMAWKSAKSVFVDSKFKVFADLCSTADSRVQGLVVKNGANIFSRSDLDKIQDIGRQNGLPGIAYIQYFEDGEKSPIFKFFGDENEITIKKQEIQKYFGCQNGDLLLFLANSDKNIIYKAQNQIRIHIAQHLDTVQDGNFIDKNILRFVWVYDFPFFEYDDKSQTIDFGHNPFSQWQGGLSALSEAQTNEELLHIKAFQYDLTLNGYEILSGGERNSNPESLTAVFKRVGYTEEEIENKFGHMMTAYRFGSPNHAGFAWGLDRLFMILHDEVNIREVIAFPKNGSGIDVMTNSPSTVRDLQLKELSIKII